MNKLKEQRPITWLLLKILLWAVSYAGFMAFCTVLSIDPVWYVVAYLFWANIVGGIST